VSDGRRELRRICVYCGSSPGRDPAYREAAEGLGTLLAQRGIGVVYGGGHVGLMGTVADAAMAAGGEVTGVIPEALEAREIGHRDITDLRVVGSMHERKLLMADLSDAFIALPGGVGTIEEIVEVFTWLQLGLHHKPVALLDVDDYWAALIAMFDHSLAEGFMKPEYRAMLLVDRDPVALLERFAVWQPPALPRWIGREQT
jgi:uncharacterized protein (TIGR00730 family)